MTRSVLLDLTPLVTVSALRGIGRYVRGLVLGLSKLGEHGLHIRGLVADSQLRGLSIIEDVAEYARRAPEPLAPAANFWRNMLVTYDLPSLSTAETKLVHLTDPKGMPWSSSEPYTLTSHDLVSLALRDLYLPKIFKWEVLYAAIERFRYWRCEAIVAVSHATKRDLCHYLGVDPAKIQVIWHGVEHERFHPHAHPGERAAITKLLGSSAPFVLYLGAGDPRKDLETLVRAYAESELIGEMPLVIAGHIGGKRADVLRALIHQLKIEEAVKLLGYVAEELVPALYRAAWVHVFPSRYEGFGLPVLEALACGAPTITSPGSSLDEVAGEAALIVPCGDEEAMTGALDSLAGDSLHRSALREKGFARAAEFTWEATGAATADFWRRCS